MVSPIAHNQYDERRYDDGETFPNKTIHYINKSLTIYYKILYLDSTHKWTYSENLQLIQNL